MDAHDHVCLCFHVPLGKVANYLNREHPAHASQISQCLGAGTGCGWCIPLLTKLHEQSQQGPVLPTLSMTSQEYDQQRQTYRNRGDRDRQTLRP